MEAGAAHPQPYSARCEKDDSRDRKNDNLERRHRGDKHRIAEVKCPDLGSGIDCMRSARQRTLDLGLGTLGLSHPTG